MPSGGLQGIIVNIFLQKWGLTKNPKILIFYLLKLKRFQMKTKSVGKREKFKAKSTKILKGVTLFEEKNGNKWIEVEV